MADVQLLLLAVRCIGDDMTSKPIVAGDSLVLKKQLHEELADSPSPQATHSNPSIDSTEVLTFALGDSDATHEKDRPPQVHEAASSTTPDLDAKPANDDSMAGKEKDDQSDTASETSDDAKSVRSSQEHEATPATSVEDLALPCKGLCDDLDPVYDITKLLVDDGKAIPRPKFTAMTAALDEYEWSRHSLFHPSCLPPTHPLLPHALGITHPNLEAPLRALPTTLVVHDPSNVLPANKSERVRDWDSETDWEDDADVLRVYRLHTGAAGEALPEERVAHLYLAADRTHGQGHHSFVYIGELDVARTLLPGYTHTLGNEQPAAEPDALAGSISLRDPEFEGVLGLAPPIARVSVAAKLGIKGDDHLAREARMYARFPAALSQHHRGTTRCTEIDEPVPYGAVVPQFFGYYVPCDEPKDKGYLSAILLVEACGTSIEGKTLNSHERRTTASLFSRLHDVGFVQNSEYPRNMLIQPGPLSLPPVQRSRSTPSFRLIDFGRAIDEEELNIIEANEDGTCSLTYLAGDTLDGLWRHTWRPYVCRYFL